MIQANIEGLQQLKDGTVKFTLACPEDQLVTVSEYRKKGKVTVMGADEAPVTDSRIIALTNLHSMAVQIAEALDRELSQVSKQADETGLFDLVKMGVEND